MLYQKELKVKYETDVFVAGGGAAGVSAAALTCDTQDVRKVNVEDLQNSLENLGAYLPNKR